MTDKTTDTTEDKAASKVCDLTWYDAKSNSGHLCRTKGPHTKHVCKICGATPPPQ